MAINDKQTQIDLVERGMTALGFLGTVLGVIATGQPWLISGYIVLLFLFTIALVVVVVYYTLPIGIPWSVVRGGVASLLSQFSHNGFSPDLVIGVGRSGSIVGAAIAANLGHCPFIALDVQHNRSTGIREVELDEPFSLRADACSGQKILLVFAYVKTTQTLRATLRYMTENGISEESISCATLFSDPQSLPDVDEMPRFYFGSAKSILPRRWSAVPWYIGAKGSKEYDWR